MAPSDLEKNCSRHTFPFNLVERNLTPPSDHFINGFQVAATVKEDVNNMHNLVTGITILCDWLNFIICFSDQLNLTQVQHPAKHHSQLSIHQVLPNNHLRRIPMAVKLVIMPL